MLLHLGSSEMGQFVRGSLNRRRERTGGPFDGFRAGNSGGKIFSSAEADWPLFLRSGV
jgi:hypothetical protein